MHDADEFIYKENNIHMVSTTSSIQYANNKKKWNITTLPTTVDCFDYWWYASLSTMFQLLGYHGVQFYWWGKPECSEKTSDLPQATHKFYHINVESSTPLSIVRH